MMAAVFLRLHFSDWSLGGGMIKCNWNRIYIRQKCQERVAGKSLTQASC